MDIDSFESTFNELTNDSEEKKKEEAELKSEEAQIKAENEAYAKGQATFDETVNELTALTSSEMEEEKEGLIPGDGSTFTRSFGLLPTPEHLKVISPEDQAFLDEVYSRHERTGVPDSYDSTAQG